MNRANLALLIMLGCLAALPLVGGAYALRLGTMVSMYAILALSWNVVGGLAGYPSFATAAFFGFGAYATGVLLNSGVPLIPSILVSLVASLVLAGLLGACCCVCAVITSPSPAFRWSGCCANSLTTPRISPVVAWG
jgi:branched-chain amino acid transport system permease protein